MKLSFVSSSSLLLAAFLSSPVPGQGQLVGPSDVQETVPRTNLRNSNYRVLAADGNETSSPTDTASSVEDTDSPTEAPLEQTSSPTEVTSPTTLFSLGDDESNPFDSVAKALIFRCQQETTPSEATTFLVQDALEMEQAAVLAVAAPHECTDPDGCLRRVDIEIDTAKIKCDETIPLLTLGHVDCVFVSGGAIGKSCKVQVGAENQQFPTALFLQDLSLETSVSFSRPDSLVVLENVEVPVKKEYYCENGLHQVQDEEQELDVNDFDPDDISCYYSDPGPMIDPPSQGHLAGLSTFIYDRMHDFERDHKEHGDLAFGSVDRSVAAVMGSSDKIPLRWLLRESSSADLPPLTIHVATDAPNANIKLATDLELTALTTTNDDEFHVAAALANSSFPNYVFIQSDDACVSSVVLKIGTFTIFEKDMEDFAKCSADFALDYDEEKKCIRLNSARFKDFALDLQQETDDSDCSQASLRRDPDFMESLTFQVEGTHLEGLSFVDSLDDLIMAPGEVLDDKVRLPVLPKIIAQPGSGLASSPSLSKFKIMSYENAVFEWDASSTFHCLSSCQPFADQSGLLFIDAAVNASSAEELLVTTATLNLAVTGCEQLQDILLPGETLGEDACTQIERPVDTLVEIPIFLASLVASGKRTLKIIPEATNASTTLYDFPDLIVPPHVRVQIDGTEVDIVVYDVRVEVSTDGVLEFADMTFGDPEGRGGSTVLINSGTMRFDSCVLQEGVQLESLLGLLEVTSSSMSSMDVSIQGGDAEFMQGKIEKLKTFENNAKSLLFDGLEVSATNLSFFSGDGDLTVAEAGVIYSLPDDDLLKAYCSNDTIAQPDLATSGAFKKVRDVEECQSWCDSISTCKGIWIDSQGLTLDADDNTHDGKAVCGLCLPESCTFDCDLDGTYILHKQPAVPFTKLDGDYCPVYEPIEVTGLPSASTTNDCRGWCSMLSFCQAYIFDAETETCAFYDSPAAALCAEVNNTLVIDTNHDAGLGKFIEAPPDLCFADETFQLTDEGLGLEGWMGTAADCAAFCGAFAECAAFDIDYVSSECRYFSWEAMLESSSNCSQTAFLSAQDSSFPQGLSESVKRFQCSADTLLADFSAVSGGVKVCETLCHTDPLCLAYTFKETESVTPDCFLWKNPSYLDWLLGSDRCDGDNGDTYLITRRVDFHEDTSMALPCEQPVDDAVSLDDCKSVCLRTMECDSFSFSTEDGCNLMCSEATNATVISANSTANSTATPQPAFFKMVVSDLKLGHVDYASVETCADRVKLASAGRYNTTSSAACRYLCDLTDGCAGYQHSTRRIGGRPGIARFGRRPKLASRVRGGPRIVSSCELYRYIATRDCDSQFEKPKTLHLAYQGKRLSEFHPAPSSTTFLGQGTTVPRANGSIRACLNACLSTTNCKAVALDWAKDGECMLYDSANYEAFSGAIDADGRQVFLSFSKYLYEEMLDGSVYNGATVLKTYDNVQSRRACISLCNAWRDDAPCLSIEYSPTSETCTMLGGEKQTSANQQGSDPYIMSKLPVNPFVKVQATSEVCPDNQDKIIEISGLWSAEACQSLCLSHTSCGVIKHDSATGLCTLYDSTSFLQGDCEDVGKMDSIYVSYLEFLLRDSLAFAPLTPMEDSTTNAVCAAGGNPVANYTNIESPSACAKLCQEAPKEQGCKAYLYNGADKMCELHKDHLEMAKCESNPAVVGISYKRMQFTGLEDVCLLETGDSSLLNTFAEIRDYPECSALCESTFGCKAFKVDGTDCKLFSTSATGTCSPTERSEGSFVHFSEMLYTDVGTGYCVVSDTALFELENIELEACKQLCDIVDECQSIEHSADGECALYQARDFFACPNSQKALYLSSARLFNVKTPARMATLRKTCLAFLDAPSCPRGTNSCGLGNKCSNNEDCKASLTCEPPSPLNTALGSTSDHNYCVPTSSGNETAASCQETCLADDLCVGAYRQGETCLRLESGDLERIEPSTNCDPRLDAELFIKYRHNPYQKMKKACLRNPLDIGPFVDTELSDCINICDSFSPCRHFTHSLSGTCELFDAQVGGVEDDCDDGVEAYINSRSFVDTVEFMGAPERIFAQVQGLSYDECAATCSRLDQCNAFIHDDGFRQSDSGSNAIVEPARLVQIRPSRKLRVMTLDFRSATTSPTSGDQEAQLVGLRMQEDLSVGDYHDQTLMIEETDITNQSRIRFRHGDLCVNSRSNQAVTCTAATQDKEISYEVLENTDGSLGLKNIYWKDFFGRFSIAHPPECLASLSHRASLTRTRCDSTHAKFDMASRPVRLAPGNAKNLCLKTGASGSVTLAKCDPTDEDQKFTYLFGTKRWVQQKKVAPQETPKDYELVEACLNSAVLKPKFVVPNDQTCEDECTSNPRCIGYIISSSGGTTRCELKPGYSTPFDSGDSGYGTAFDSILDRQLKGQAPCELGKIFMRGYSTSTTSAVSQERGKLVVAGSCYNDAGNPNQIGEVWEGDWLECTARCNELEDCIGFEYCPGDKVCSHSREGLNGYKVVTPFDARGKSGACMMRSSVGENTCLPTVNSYPMMTYRKGKTRDGPITTEADQCLVSVPGEGGAKLELKACDSVDEGAVVTSSLGPDNTIRFGGQCLAVATDEGSQVKLEPCEDSHPSQQWFGDTICQLTTREKTSPFKLESFSSPGRCLAMDRKIFDDSGCASTEQTKKDIISFSNDNDVGTALCDTADATKFQYFYSQSEQDSFLMKQLNGNQCVNRVMNPDDPKAIQEDSVEWGSCSAEDGAENTWELVDGTTFRSAKTDDDTSVKLFDLALSGCNQKVVSTNIDVTPALRSWRKYGLENSAVELAIKPNALIQEITDPAIKLQIWLFSDEGRRSRMLLSRLELFAEFPDILSSFLAEVESTSDKIGSGLATAASFIDPMAVGAGRVVTFVTVVVPVLMILERLPYVGPVVRAIKLRKIMKSAKSKIKGGKRTLKPLKSTVGAGRSTVLSLPPKVAMYKGFLDGLPAKFDVLGRIVVRLTRCAFVDGNTKLQDTLNRITDGIIDAVDMGYEAMTTMRQMLSGIGNFWEKVESTLVKPIGAVKKVLDFINKIFDKFKFLETIILFKLKLTIPIIGRIEFGIIDIANFLGRIERAIKKIPFVGWAWRAVEKLVSSVMGLIFPKIELPLPNLNFLDKLSPFDALEEIIEEIVGPMSERLANVGALIDGWAPDLFDVINVDRIMDKVGSIVPDLDLFDGCEDTNGTFDLSCATKLIPDIPGVPTDFVQEGIDFFANVKDGISQKFSNHMSAISDSLSRVECVQNSTIGMPEEGLQKLFESIGIDSCEDCAALFTSSMPTEIPYCSKFGVDQNATLSSLQPLIDDLQEIFDREKDVVPSGATRRKLGSFNQTVVDEGLSIIFTTTIPIRPMLPGGIGRFINRFAFGNEDESIVEIVSVDDDTGDQAPKKKKKNFFQNKLEKAFAKGFGPIDGPHSFQATYATKEVLAINVAWTRKEVEIDGEITIQKAMRFSLGARWQFQAGAGINPSYFDVVQPKLDQLNKLISLIETIDEECSLLVSEEILPVKLHLFENIQRDMRKLVESSLNDRDLFEGWAVGRFDDEFAFTLPVFKKGPPLKLKSFNGRLDVAQSDHDFRISKKQTLLAQNIGRIITKNKIPGLIKKMQKIQDSCYPAGKTNAIAAGTFFQARVKARGTQFPDKAVQLLYGFQVGVSPRSLKRSGSLRYDFFQKNKKKEDEVSKDEVDPKVFEFQDRTRNRGNIALMFHQPKAAAAYSVTGHVGLGFNVFAIEFIAGAKTPSISFGGRTIVKDDKVGGEVEVDE